jgi:hypothetical protein
MIMGSIAQSLLRRATSYQSSEHGIKLEDFSVVPACQEISDDLARGLHSEDPFDRRISLFFCEGFLKHGRIVELGKCFTDSLPTELVRLANDRDDLTRSAAHILVIGLRHSIADYRAIMMRAFLDSDAQIRSAALNAADTFLKGREIEPLLSFEGDAYVSEIAHGGPMHYVLRDDALEKIEQMLDKTFAKHELTELREGDVVFWWDWRPMLAWHRGSKTGFLAKLRYK